MAIDPYAPPQRIPESESIPSSSIGIRRTHLAHEGSVRLFGLAILFPGFGLILMAAYSLVFGRSANTLGGALMGLLLAAFLIWLGLGMMRLQPAAYQPGVSVGVLSLLAFPFGTIAGLLILYLLATKKGRRLFSREYQTILAETPDLKARAPLPLRICFVLLIVLFVLAQLDDHL